MQMNPGTVLIVDDDAAVRSALKFALEAEGFEVRLYEGPVALLTEVNFPRRGCMVVDYRMPVMDGLELIEVLAARQVALPAILITGRISKDLSNRAAKSGVRQVLEKPLSDGALVESIRSILLVAD